MPRPHAQGSLLCAAVRGLYGRLDESDAGAIPARAYVLGRQPGDWTVDDVLPTTGLIGWTAPASCWAVAVVASGQAQPTKPGSAGGQDVEGRSARLAVGVARSGDVAGRLGVSGGVSDAAPMAGRLLDTLRRNLGLPTPAPAEGTARFVAVLWLAAILDAGRSIPGPLGWRAVVDLHPAAGLLLGRGERVRGPALETIVALTPATWTWDVLREAEIRPGSITPQAHLAIRLPAPVASWMDTGMYARWILSDLPTPEFLWRQVGPLLTPSVGRRLEKLLHRSGVTVDGKCPDSVPA